MHHIENNLKTINRRIMRRVWYIYGISLLRNPIVGVGVVFGASVTLFFKLVSVTSILHNLLEVQLGAVPHYIWQTFAKAFTDGEFLKLVSLGLIVASVFYLRSLLRNTSFGSPAMRSA